MISDSTTPSTSTCITAVPNKDDLMLEIDKLRRLCSNVELDFNSAKNDLSHLQETVTNLQKTCNLVDDKMDKFLNQMKCMERQQAIMLNVGTYRVSNRPEKSIFFPCFELGFEDQK